MNDAKYYNPIDDVEDPEKVIELLESELNQGE